MVPNFFKPYSYLPCTKRTSQTNLQTVTLFSLLTLQPEPVMTILFNTQIIFYFLFLILITISRRTLLASPPSSSSSLTTFRQTGEWTLLQESIGISAMHMQVLRNNKVIMFDRTDFGPSNLPLPKGHCRYDLKEIVLQTDCTAHSVLYDFQTNSFRPLFVQTDTWCSSGAVLPNGVLVQTGGYNDGELNLRMFAPLNNNHCDWVEHQNYLSVPRWYATNHILPGGRIIIVGGRDQDSYEFYPKSNRDSSRSSHFLSFLVETRDEFENNLYPFLHLLPDGNLFIFANTRSISFDYVNNRVVKEYPPIQDPRNYPSTGSSVLLPIFLDNHGNVVEAEILLCGGAPQGSYSRALQGEFIRASSSCGRLRVTDPNPVWVMEDMPMARVMGDMLILPTGEILILNGAGQGTAGWDMGRDPVTEPVIYNSREPINRRFSVMTSSNRPRMYHSTAVLVPDGRILVGGSNTNPFYNFTGVLYPTDISLQAFSPPYLAPGNSRFTPVITSFSDTLSYGQTFSIVFTVRNFFGANHVTVRIIWPPFTTHSFGMSQRMVVLNIVWVSESCTSSSCEISVVGPPTAEIAPSGYYMMFVVHAGIPSHGVWVKFQ